MPDAVRLAARVAMEHVEVEAAAVLDPEARPAHLADLAACEPHGFTSLEARRRRRPPRPIGRSPHHRQAVKRLAPLEPRAIAHARDHAPVVGLDPPERAMGNALPPDTMRIHDRPARKVSRQPGDRRRAVRIGWWVFVGWWASYLATFLAYGAALVWVSRPLVPTIVAMLPRVVSLDPRLQWKGTHPSSLRHPIGSLLWLPPLRMVARCLGRDDRVVVCSDGVADAIRAGRLLLWLPRVVWMPSVGTSNSGDAPSPVAATAGTNAPGVSRPSHRRTRRRSPPCLPRSWAEWTCGPSRPSTSGATGAGSRRATSNAPNADAGHQSTRRPAHGHGGAPGHADRLDDLVPDRRAGREGAAPPRDTPAEAQVAVRARERVSRGRRRPAAHASRARRPRPVRDAVRDLRERRGVLVPARRDDEPGPGRTAVALVFRGRRGPTRAPLRCPPAGRIPLAHRVDGTRARMAQPSRSCPSSPSTPVDSWCR